MVRKDKKENKTNETQANLDSTTFIRRGSNSLDGDDAYFPDIGEQVEFNKSTESMNEDMIEMFPDILSGFNVIEATVINAEPSFNVEGTLPPTSLIKLLAQVKRTINNKYKLNEGLRETFKNALFLKGSEAFISIPHDVLETVLQSTVNISNESDITNIAKSNRIIKPNRVLSKLKINFTDNIGLLKASGICEKAMIDSSHNELLPVTESNVSDIEKMFKTITNPEIAPQLKLGLSDNYKGNGVHMKVDSNYMVPLKIGDKVTGYLLTLNETGGLLKKNDLMNLNMNVVSRSGSTDEIKEEFDRYKKNMGVSQRKAPMMNMPDELIFDHLIMDEIKRSLNASEIGKLIDIPNMNNITKVMFDRALEAKTTNLLYLPAEYVTYYMFNERKNGTGKSLIEIVGHLLSIRAMLTFAKIRSDIENALPKMRVDVDVNPNIKNVEKFMSKFIAKHTQSRNKMYKWGGHSVDSTAAWIQSTGVSYNFKSDKVPYSEVTENNVTGQAGTIDLTFLDDVKSDIYRRFGLTKQMIDSSAESEFATISVLSNELSKKEMSSLQNILIRHYSNHCRQVLSIDGEFLTVLRDIIDKDYRAIYNSYGEEFRNKIKHLNVMDDDIKKFFLKDILSRISATLPTLRNEDESTLKTRFEGYKDSLDSVIDAMIFQTDGVVGMLVDDKTKNLIRTFKASYKQMLLRKWMNENNYMVEVSDIIRIEDGVVNVEHMNEMIGNLEQLIKALSKLNVSIVNAQNTDVGRKDLNKESKNNPNKGQSNDENGVQGDNPNDNNSSDGDSGVGDDNLEGETEPKGKGTDAKDIDKTQSVKDKVKATKDILDNL